MTTQTAQRKSAPSGSNLAHTLPPRSVIPQTGPVLKPQPITARKPIVSVSAPYHTLPQKPATPPANVLSAKNVPTMTPAKPTQKPAMISPPKPNQKPTVKAVAPGTGTTATHKTGTNANPITRSNIPATNNKHKPAGQSPAKKTMVQPSAKPPGAAKKTNGTNPPPKTGDIPPGATKGKPPAKKKSDPTTPKGINLNLPFANNPIAMGWFQAGLDNGKSPLLAALEVTNKLNGVGQTSPMVDDSGTPPAKKIPTSMILIMGGLIAAYFAWKKGMFKHLKVG